MMKLHLQPRLLTLHCSPSRSKAQCWAFCWVDAWLCVSLVLLSVQCDMLQGLLSPWLPALWVNGTRSAGKQPWFYTGLPSILHLLVYIHCSKRLHSECSTNTHYCFHHTTLVYMCTMRKRWEMYLLICCAKVPNKNIASLEPFMSSCSLIHHLYYEYTHFLHQYWPCH